MRIREAFPSKYAAAADLLGDDLDVQISHVVMEEVNNDGVIAQAPIIYFHGMKKGMRLNRTNANTIADLYGDDTDNWAGEQITLFPTQAELRGKQVPAIRVRIAAPTGNTQTVQLPPQPPVTHTQAGF